MKKYIVILGIILLSVFSVSMAQDCQTIYDETYELLTSAKTAFDADDQETGLDLVAQAQEALQPCLESTDCPVSRLNTLLTQVSNAPANSRAQLLNGALTLFQECGIEVTTTTPENVISLANIAQLTQVRVDELPVDPVSYIATLDIAIETDEWVIVGGDYDTNVQILRYVPTIGWELLNSVSTNSGDEFIMTISVSKDGQFAFFGIGYYLFVIDVEQGTVVSRELVGSISSVFDVRTSPDGAFVGVAIQPNLILYTTDPIEQVAVINQGTVPLSVDFHSNGEWVAVAAGGTVNIYNLDGNYTSVASLNASSTSVTKVMFLGQSNQIAAFSDTAMTVWDVDTQTLVTEITVINDYVIDATASVSGDLAFVPFNGGVQIIDVTQGQVINTLSLPDVFPNRVIITPDGDQLFVLTSDKLFIYEIQQ